MFHHQPLIPSAGGGGDSFPDGYKGSAATYSDTTALLTADGDRADMQIAGGFIGQLRRISSSLTVCKEVDASLLSAATGGVTEVTTDALDGYDNGPRVVDGVIAIPVMGTFEFNSLNMGGLRAQVLVTAPNVAAGQGVGIGLVSVTADRLIAGGYSALDAGVEWHHSTRWSSDPATPLQTQPVAGVYKTTANPNGQLATIELGWAALSGSSSVTVYAGADWPSNGSGRWAGGAVTAGMQNRTDIQVCLIADSAGQSGFSAILKSIEWGPTR